MLITHDNHYVPRLYLKHFASENGYLYRYRTLVSKESVPEWKRVNVGGVGYQVHLYTRVLVNEDTDEIEKWLNRDFETPAEGALSRAVHDERLSKNDYRVLNRFLAAQMVRTPAFLIENLPRWNQLAEKLLNDSMGEVRETLEKAKETGNYPDSAPIPNSEYLPLRVTKEPSKDGKSIIVKAQTVVGRGTWIFAMRHLLTNTLDRLAEHRWTILSAEDDLPWFTTDDPVVRLNFRSATNYDFKGGWGSPGTEIMLPLSPKHLLYTQVGQKPPSRGSTFSRAQASMLRRLIAEHAHRYIFSKKIDLHMPNIRPRVVNAEAVRNENEQWKNWHREQRAAELEFVDNFEGMSH
jgi:Protein of unknown function (DUF4238)